MRLLVVCTANICRSPMGAVMLEAAARSRGIDLDVSSAGFLFSGHPASDASIKTMKERGFDLRTHRSRIIDQALVDASDLILTMERRHARDVLLNFPGNDKVFTFKGFAESASIAITSGAMASGVEELIQDVAVERSAAALLGDERPDEVRDPHGRSMRLHRHAADEISAAAHAIAAAFAAAEGSRS